MARNISFSLTKKQIKERTKFETRRPEKEISLSVWFRKPCTNF